MGEAAKTKPTALSVTAFIATVDKEALLEQLGRHKGGLKQCLYINKLADLDLRVLKKVLVGGLANFGINLTELAPGAVSALLHHHSRQDEFIYIVAGTPTLVLDDEEHLLQPGNCCGFKAGTGVGHPLANKSVRPVLYLEIGDRTVGDYAEYPRDDLKFAPAEGGGWILTHKDGTPYA